MKSRPRHRKLVKHYEDPGHVRELTFSCYRRMPLLTNDTWREMLSRSIDAAAERHGWRLTAFVFMPEHVHLLFYPLPGASKIDSLLKAIKRPYSFRVKQMLVQHGSPLVKRLTIRQRPGVTTFRRAGTAGADSGATAGLPSSAACSRSVAVPREWASVSFRPIPCGR